MTNGRQPAGSPVLSFGKPPATVKYARLSPARMVTEPRAISVSIASQSF